jgi:hypothetical protein
VLINWVKAALDNKLEEPKVRDRHMAVDEISEAEISEWIDAQAEKCNSVTRIDLRNDRESVYSISIS